MNTRTALLWLPLPLLPSLLKVLQGETQCQPILRRKTLLQTPQTLLEKTLRYSYAICLGIIRNTLLHIYFLQTDEEKVNIQYFIKKIYFFPFACSWKCLWKPCLFFFFFYLCCLIFLQIIITVYYMDIFALKLSEGNAINILYICKFWKDYHIIKFAEKSLC